MNGRQIRYATCSACSTHHHSECRGTFYVEDHPYYCDCPCAMPDAYEQREPTDAELEAMRRAYDERGHLPPCTGCADCPHHAYGECAGTRPHDDADRERYLFRNADPWRKP